MSLVGLKILRDGLSTTKTDTVLFFWSCLTSSELNIRPCSCTSLEIALARWSKSSTSTCSFGGAVQLFSVFFPFSFFVFKYGGRNYGFVRGFTVLVRRRVFLEEGNLTFWSEGETFLSGRVISHFGSGEGHFCGETVISHFGHGEGHFWTGRFFFFWGGGLKDNPYLGKIRLLWPSRLTGRP